MKEKIAVQCRTEIEWDKVVSKLKLKGPYPWDNSRSDICISTDGSGYGDVRIQTEDGYTIISASDYLKEGEVEELKVGDEVKFVKGGLCGIETTEWWKSEAFILGNTYKVYAISDMGSLKVIAGGLWHHKDHFELTNKQNKPKSKESNMKDNGIDSNVLAVFGDKVKGSELVVIDRHFTEQMLTRIIMEKHHKEIQSACKDAEAEAIKTEEAKK